MQMRNPHREILDFIVRKDQLIKKRNNVDRSYTQKPEKCKLVVKAAAIALSNTLSGQ
jgi:hypothetical protein